MSLWSGNTKIEGLLSYLGSCHLFIKRVRRYVLVKLYISFFGHMGKIFPLIQIVNVTSKMAMLTFHQ